MKSGSYAAIGYGTKVVESTEVRNFVEELCSYFVEMYGDMFLNRTLNSEEGNLIEKVFGIICFPGCIVVLEGANVSEN